MAVLTTAPTLVSRQSEIPERTLLAGLALTSFAALLLELALTRLFSVVLFYHFAFLAISIALLGLGAGGVFAYLLKRRSRASTPARWHRDFAHANAVVVVVVLEIVLHVPRCARGFREEFPAADGALSGRGSSFLSDRPAVLGCLRARDAAAFRAFTARTCAEARWPAWRWCRC